MTSLHWTQRVPRQFELAGFGDIRCLNASEGNSFEQCFMSSIRRDIEYRSINKAYDRDNRGDYIADWEEIERIVEHSIEEDGKNERSFIGKL